ncbi:MAG: nucleoside-triphosphatase [Halodesulfurarchaeum sp.]
MPNNVLVTGPPRSGKTTVLERLVDCLREEGLALAGVWSPEVRDDGNRVGFDIVDLASGERAVLARKGRGVGPQVGSYRVDVPATEALCEQAFEAVESADAVVIDEIAPMEVTTDAFVAGVRTALDSPIPVVAAVHYRATSGFIGAVKDRDDTTTFEVTEDSRDELPDRLARLVLDRV